MTNMKICPLCRKENLEDASICSNCGFDLNPTYAARSNDVPDWLSSFREETENDAIFSEEKPLENLRSGVADDTPDWLSRIRERKTDDDAYQPLEIERPNEFDEQVFVKKTDELVDSLRNEGAEADKQESPSDDLISDLRNLQDPFSPSQEENFPGASKTAQSEYEGPDPEINDEWIARFSSAHIPAIEIEPIEEIKSRPREDKIPDWIAFANLDSTPAPDTAKKEQAFPEWISKFRNDQDTPLEDDAGSAEEGLPDWVQNPFAGEQEVQSEDINVDRPPFWLEKQGELGDVMKQSAPDADVPEWVAAIDQKTAVLQDAALEAELPDWITTAAEEPADLEFEAALTGSLRMPADAPDEPLAANLPFIEETEEQPEEVPEEAPAEESAGLKESLEFVNQMSTPPFQIEQIPDWLENDEDLFTTSFFDDEAISARDQSGVDEASDIEPGELPSWLKAMRPLEAIAPAVSASKERKQIEKSGPLAGLQGVLSSQLVTPITAPPPQSMTTLEISERQMKQIEILGKLFEQEEETHTETAKKRDISGTLIRIFAPLALLAVIVFSLFFTPSSAPAPTTFPPETVRFASIVNGLLLNQQAAPRILTVMETEGASAAEISMLTEGIFERLMIRDSYLSVISTNPNGSLLASEIIRKAAANNAAYNYADNVANFGFLPGGVTAIQSFIASPSETAVYGLDNELVWEKPGLQGIGAYADFDAILLVTDDADAARIWIEQTSLLSPDATLLVASAAQALPMLKPYVDSNQIDGMIGGLYGGLAYEELIQGRNETYAQYWNLQNAGILLFIAVIALGAIWQLFIFVTRWIGSRNRGTI